MSKPARIPGSPDGPANGDDPSPCSRPGALGRPAALGLHAALGRPSEHRCRTELGRPARVRHLTLAVVLTAALITLTACGGRPTGPPGSDAGPGPGAGTGSTTASPSAASPSAASPTGGSEGDRTLAVEHAQGTTEVPADPQKVFVFDLGVMDSLHSLGIQPDGVPDAPYPEELQAVADDALVRIGTLTEPDLETIADEAPDLVIVSERTAESYPEISQIAPTIDLSLEASDAMGSFVRNVTTLGEIFGAEAAVEARLAEIDTKVQDARTALRAAGNTDGLIVMTSGEEITAFGPRSRSGLIHDPLGVPPAALMRTGSPEGTPVSVEFIARTDPDNLFVIDRDAALGHGDGASELLDDDLVHGTTAARNGKVIRLDPARWYLVGYGLENLHQMINEVVNRVATESTTGSGTTGRGGGSSDI